MKQIGICGTFDVENYGDLLFPLIAERELTERLGPMRLCRFSYFPKTTPSWPYEVTSLVELPRLIGDLDGLIIGGGHLIRFDKQIAPGYCPPTPDLHHPTSYWLTPALMALQCNVPVVWNAPSVYDHFPVWAEPLLEMAIKLSSYVMVRDELSWRALARFAHENAITVGPDTALGVGRLLDPRQPSPDFARMRETMGLTAPYIVVQATHGLDAFVRLAQEHPAALAGHQLVVVPIGPSHGDNPALLIDTLPQALCLPAWPHPLTLAELIGGAAAVVGTSLHLALTALACGVPSFRPAQQFTGKYAILSGFDTVYAFDDQAKIEPQWFTARLGATAPSPAVCAANERLTQHWDRIASSFEGARRQTDAQALSRFWQALPGLLEDSATRLEETTAVLAAEREDWHRRAAAQNLALAERDVALAEREETTAVLAAEREDWHRRTAAQNLALAERDASLAEHAGRLTEAVALTANLNQQITRLNHLLAQARLEISDRDGKLTKLRDSTSWKMTAPLRSLGQRLLRWQTKLGGLNGRGYLPKERLFGGRRVMRLKRIERAALASEPFGWAFIDGLFSPRDAKALAESFPHSHFKTVAGYDGEKGYEYEARLLLGMGATTPSEVASLSPVWRRLAADLLSPAYRLALTRLTGIDLSTVPMEANVFHYGPGAWLGPHLDLNDKIVTHVFYFNDSWDEAAGGCLTILRSGDMADAAAVVTPVVSHSVVLVRSEKSWHAVSRVAADCHQSRRSLTVTFYHPDSISTMWPPGDETPLHNYLGARNGPSR